MRWLYMEFAISESASTSPGYHSQNKSTFLWERQHCNTHNSGEATDMSFTFDCSRLEVQVSAISAKPPPHRWHREYFYDGWLTMGTNYEISLIA